MLECRKYPHGEAWRLNDRLHRENGPAVTMYGVCSWYLYGELYHKEEYFEKLEKLKGKEHADKIRLIYV